MAQKSIGKKKALEYLSQRAMIFRSEWDRRNNSILLNGVNLGRITEKTFKDLDSERMIRINYHMADEEYWGF